MYLLHNLSFYEITKISTQQRNNPNKTRIMIAMIPITSDIFRSSWAEVSFLMNEEIRVLFTDKSFLLSSTDSFSVWFEFLQMQKQKVLLVITFCVVTAIVNVVGFCSVVGCMSEVVAWNVVDSVKVGAEHEIELVGFFLLAK